MAETVKTTGGEVVIFSSMHETGQRECAYTIVPYFTQFFLKELNQLTGVAAILTFPLDVDIVEAEEKEAKEEAARAAAEQNG